MEEQIKSNSFNVMEGSGENKGVAKCAVPVKACDLLLRLLAFVLTLVAAVFIGADKQKTIVPIKLVDSMTPFNLPVTAKWHYLSTFVYFVGANAIACAYATLSLLLTLANRCKSKGIGTLITVFDTLVVALLFSANGAAIAVSLLGLQGKTHFFLGTIEETHICIGTRFAMYFAKFCDQVAASLFISLLGSIAFLLLLLLPPLLRLQRTT